MTTPSRVWALATSLVLAGALAACGGNGTDDDEPSGAGTTGAGTESADPMGPTDSADPMGQAATVMTAESDLGTILVDADGATLYLFTNDSPGVSTCEDACLAAWPPLIGEPEAGTGVDDSLLGTLTRSDGSTQVTYNGWPLYYWANDVAAGDTTGQGVNGVWFVVDPEGEAIGATP